jgi:hypothetical protein
MVNNMTQREVNEQAGMLESHPGSRISQDVGRFDTG